MRTQTPALVEQHTDPPADTLAFLLLLKGLPGGPAMLKASPASSLPLLFLSLLFLGVSPQCHKATEDECQEHKDFVPGHSLAGEGIDITTMEKKGAKVLDMNQWQRPDRSCTLCQNPLLEGKPLQRLPVAAVDWEAKASCQRSVHASLQESGISLVLAEGSDVKNDWKAGLEVEVKPQAQAQVALAGSRSKMAEFSREKSSQDKYSFASHEVSCSYYSFRVGHYLPLSSHFKYAVKTLPKKYRPDSRLEYRQLIQTYGTHFIQQIHLGGRVRDVTAVRVCEVALDGATTDEVKDCLSLEAAASLGKVKMHATFQKCEELRKKGNFKGSFHQTYSERQTEIVGGNSQADVLFCDGQSTEPFKDWLESLKSFPGMVSYSLMPIHTLVTKGDPKREGLRQALSEYVRERAMWRNCSQACPPGTRRSARDSCSCICASDGATNAMCCSRARGLGKLTVTIVRARNLWGDYWSRTDAFVKVFYNGREMRTPTIWNNDNPEWKVHLDVGDIQVLGETSKVRVQVWDEDNRWDDDLLGSCDEPLQAGKLQKKICYLNHGSLEFQYHLECGPFLGGPYCLDYTPQKPNYVGDLLQWNG